MHRLSLISLFYLACLNMVPAWTLENAYQTGRILLQPDSTYGRKTDWAKIFPVYPEYGATGETSLLAVAGDGTCFVLNGIAYQIHKFSPNGDLLRSWGKKGGKPGEFPSQPRSLILLDDRNVLVADTSMGRINVYDLDGRFVKMLQADFTVHRMVPLEQGNFAVTSSVPIAKGGSKRIVAIMNLDGSKKIIASRIENTKMVFAQSKQHSIMVSRPFNWTYSFSDRTREGNLIYGVSDKPELILYSPTGQEVGRIALNLTSIPISAGEQAKAREGMRKKLEDLKSRFGDLEVTETPHAFEGNTPYFTRLLVDSVGNALVFKFSKDDHRQFQVYQIQGNGGRMLCEVNLEIGTLGSFANLGALEIRQSFLYTIAYVKNGESNGWRLVRIPWVSAAK